MAISARDHVKHLAQLDAADYVQEHGTAIDPDSPDDFDSLAWESARRDAGLTRDEQDQFWPVYRRAFIAETRRLVRLAT